MHTAVYRNPWHWRLAGPSLLLATFVILPSCTVGPNYRRPNVRTPSVFRGASGAAQQASFADQPWWGVFRDKTLTDLVKTALANNYDLAAAVARVEQARQIAAQARAQYFPAISYLSVLTYGHNQFTGSPASNLPGAQGFFLGIVRAAWEPDLWGRIRRTNEAARADFFASEDVRRGVMLTLMSDVSDSYFELLGLRYQLAIAQETTESYAATLRLFTKRFQEGIGNSLQTSRAAADLQTAAASIPELQRVIALKENQICVLLGKNPGSIETKITLLDEAIPPEVPAATRAEQLQAVQSNQKAIQLAQMRYLDGISSYFEVLEAQQRLFLARLALVQTEVNRRLVIVQLYDALGGGWNLTDAQWTP